MQSIPKSHDKYKRNLLKENKVRSRINKMSLKNLKVMPSKNKWHINPYKTYNRNPNSIIRISKYAKHKRLVNTFSYNLHMGNT